MSKQQRIRVFIADDIEDTCENIKKLLMFESDIEVVGSATNGQEATELCRSLTPDIALLDVDMPGLDGITATEVIRAESPSTQVIVMSELEEPSYIRRSMLAGAREFLVKPFAGDELAQAIRRVHERADRVLVQTTRPPEQQQAEPSLGRIYTVFSPKGGVGRTSVACNLAVALKQRTGRSVALIDGNFSFGDVAVFLNLQPIKTIVDLLPHLAALDDDVLRDLMVTHSSGVEVLLAPTRPEMAELVTPDALKRIITRLREAYDYVVIDTQPTFHDNMLTVLDLSDRILLLITLEMTGLKDAKLFLEVSEVLHYPPDKVNLVVNRVDSFSGITVQDIEEHLGRSVFARIANDFRIAVQSLNQGVPFVVSQPKSQIARSIGDMAQSLVVKGSAREEETNKAEERRGVPLIGRWISGGRSQQPTLAPAGSHAEKR